MCELIIEGSTGLKGEVTVQGSKNTTAALMAAAVLTDEECVIHNCPNTTEIKKYIEILRNIGVDVHMDKNCVHMCARSVKNDILKNISFDTEDASMLLLGAILARKGKGFIGDVNGLRPNESAVDLYLKTFKSIGVDVDKTGEYIFCGLNTPKSAEINLLYPNAGVTESIMILCGGLDNVVKIHGAAKDPEVVELQNFLNLMGANIKGAGTDIITIYPVDKLGGCVYTVPSDRIVAATYMLAVAAGGGKVYVKGAEKGHLMQVIGVLKEMGCAVLCDDNGILVEAENRCRPLEMIKTLPYPGFPLELQPILGAVLTFANGESKITRETVFDRKCGYIKELVKMGADIEERNGVLIIKGTNKMHGGMVSPKGLWESMAIVTAAIGAKGITVLEDTKYIDMGYESIEKDLRALGANIRRIEK